MHVLIHAATGSCFIEARREPRMRAVAAPPVDLRAPVIQPPCSGPRTRVLQENDRVGTVR